jgi:hypothetical protein
MAASGEKPMAIDTAKSKQSQKPASPRVGHDWLAREPELPDREYCAQSELTSRPTGTPVLARSRHEQTAEPAEAGVRADAELALGMDDERVSPVLRAAPLLA